MKIRYSLASRHASVNLHLKILIIAILLVGLPACGRSNQTPGAIPTRQSTQTAVTSQSPEVTAIAIPTLTPSRLLSICLIQEPRSLFLYEAVSTSERSVLAAIYDGPIDVKGFSPQAVILEKIPSPADGDAVFRAIQVSQGDLIVDALGNLRNMDEGVQYRPSECYEQACTKKYSGPDPVEMDQLVLRFKLLPELKWSDGNPLTAADSVYSYEIARNLYPTSLPERLARTASYTALDDLNVEWAGVPGFVDGLYQTKFFSPLPQHAWANLQLTELPTAEVSSRKPMGWGAYVIDEWVPGDHITLHANPLYFRASEGLPYFNNLVYRIVSDSDEAQAAVLAGECDLVDQTSGLETKTASLIQQRDAGQISVTFQAAFAWDVLEFDLLPLSEDRPAFFASREVRQGVAMCIDRQALVEQLSGGQMLVADLYTPPAHPLFNPEATAYAFDPQAGSELLTTAGWLDNDDDPSTPRTAQGVAGIADGTPFEVQYLVSDDDERRAAAEMIQADLMRCGIQLDILAQPVDAYLAAGPDGPVFGRKFDLAQFAWMTATEPPCSLFLSSEIPGAYPDYPKGWGGVNASGYSNPQYDQACLDALYSLPETAQHVEKHAEAQSIFAEDLPALPLYWHYRVVIGRPDICGLPTEMVTDNIFSGLELFNYGDGCP